MITNVLKREIFLYIIKTGVAWLSSARAVRCLVKSFNERNPYFLLLINLIKWLFYNLRTLKKLPLIKRRKERMTSSQYGPYELGYTRATMDFTKRGNNASWSESSKIFLVRIVLCNSRT